jgi:hypothetical protein
MFAWEGLDERNAAIFKFPPTTASFCWPAASARANSAYCSGHYLNCTARFKAVKRGYLLEFLISEQSYPQDSGLLEDTNNLVRFGFGLLAVNADWPY